MGLKLAGTVGMINRANAEGGPAHPKGQRPGQGGGKQKADYNSHHSTSSSRSRSEKLTQALAFIPAIMLTRVSGIAKAGLKQIWSEKRLFRAGSRRLTIVARRRPSTVWAGMGRVNYVFRFIGPRASDKECKAGSTAKTPRREGAQVLPTDHTERNPDVQPRKPRMQAKKDSGNERHSFHHEGLEEHEGGSLAGVSRRSSLRLCGE